MLQGGWAPVKAISLLLFLLRGQAHGNPRSIPGHGAGTKVWGWDAAPSVGPSNPWTSEHPERAVPELAQLQADCPGPITSEKKES